MATPTYVVQSPSAIGRAACASSQDYVKQDCYSKTLKQYCRDNGGRGNDSRHCIGDNHMNNLCSVENGQCRKHYPTYMPWCCVCQHPHTYHNSHIASDSDDRPSTYLRRRRCRSESTERDSSGDTRSAYYASRIPIRGEDCDRTFTRNNTREYNLRSGTNYHERFRNKISRKDDVYEFFDSPTVSNQQIYGGYPCFDLIKPTSSEQHVSVRNNPCRQLLGSCENHSELIDRNIYFSKKCADENIKCCSEFWVKPLSKEPVTVPGHLYNGNDRYMQEVEMLRSKLRELKEGTHDGKRLRQLSESEKGISSDQDAGTKRPRDSPKIKTSHVQSAVDLPLVNPAMLVPRIPCPNIPGSEEGTSISSDSECADSASDDNYTEEEIKDEPDIDNEEIMKQTLSQGVTSVSGSSSSSPSHVVGDVLGSISLSDVQSVDCEFPVAIPEPAISINSGEVTVGSSLTQTLTESPASVTTAADSLASTLGTGSYSVTEMTSVHPGLRASLFSHVPPFINFSDHEQKGPEFPNEVQVLLKWKMSRITPVIVRKTILNTGFRLVRRSNEWCGTWGKHMKSICFKTLCDFQKMNHLPGSFQIGRKDNLWKNLLRHMTKYGKREFGFMPRTYVLPQDNKLLRSAWEKHCGKARWIVKPPASARGAGIKVIHKWTQIPKKCPLIVQKYITDPYLINGSKFDLRLYALVTSINPLRIYLYDNGLVRFASVKYSSELSALVDRYMHLTNYSINKLSSQYKHNEDAGACQGHKWTLRALWAYLEKEKGVNVQKLWSHMVDLVVKTMISGESSITQLSRAHLSSRYCSYELFGVDILLDQDLKPWLLEVNISPSLHSSTPLDMAVKGPMVRDLLNIAGYQIPNKLTAAQQESLYAALGVQSSFCYDKRLYTMLISPEERVKQTDYQQMETREEYINNILNDLTSDDVRHLIQYEDELTQLGGFVKIFPTENTHHYMQFFEAPRYYNMLLDAWETKFYLDRAKGIQLLEELCRKQIHLHVNYAQLNRTKASTNHTTTQLEEEQVQAAVQAQDVEEELVMDEGGRNQRNQRPLSDEDTKQLQVDKPRDPQWTLSATTLCRAARSRSGKPGIVMKPFPRSSFITRRSSPLNQSHHEKKTSLKIKS